MSTMQSTIRGRNNGAWPSDVGEIKTRSAFGLLLLVAAILTLCVPTASYATTYTWTGTGNGNWTDITRWGGVAYPNAVGDVASITVSATGARTVTLSVPVTIGQMDLAKGGAVPTRQWIVAGTGTITLDNGVNKPIVRCLNGHYGTCNVILAGSNGVRFNDAGYLVLGAACTYTGDTEINRGTTMLANANVFPNASILGRSGNLLFVDASPGEWGTLDLGRSIQINGLSSTAGGTITTTSNSVTLTLGDNNANGSFAGVIQNGLGTVALTKIGTGTQTFTAAQTYTGPTAINGGTLALTGAGSLSSQSAITLGSGGTFDVSGITTPPYSIVGGQTFGGSSATGTVAGNLTLDGSASLVLSFAAGSPTLTTTGDLNLSGAPTTVNVTANPLGDGTYKLISKSGSGKVIGPVGTVTVGGFGIVGGGTASLSIISDELWLTISGGATVVQWGSGNGTWAVGTSGWNSGGGTTWANGYAALLTDTYSTGNPVITLNTEVLPQVMYFNSTKTYTITGSGDIGGSAELRKLNSGVLTLDVANTHTGGSTLFSGTLDLKNPAALGATFGQFTISGGALDNSSGGPLTLSDYPQAWNGDFAFAGTGDLNLGAGSVNMSASRTINVTNSTLTVGGPISGTDASITKSGAGALTLNGDITTGAGGLTVDAGTLTLAGNNSLTGPVALNAGEIVIGNNNAFNSITYNTLTIPDSAASKTLTLNGHLIYVASLTQGGTANPTAAVIRNNHASTAATLIANAPASTTFVGVIEDGGAAPLALTKTGGGTLKLGTGGVGTGSFTYSGNTTVSGGTLQAGAPLVFPHGVGKGNMVVNAVLDMVDRSITLNGLYGSGRITHGNSGSAVLQVGENGANGDFAGAIQDVTTPPVQLTKIGTGTQILRGTNSYNGATLVNAGTLLVNSPGSLKFSTVTVNADGTFGGTGIIANGVTVNANATLSAATTTSAGVFTVNGLLTLAAGATNVWQLAANDIINTGGTNFDQVAINGGLSIDPASVLVVNFTGTATTPNLSDPFWQYPRQWQVLVGNPSGANFGAIEGTNGITAGTFTTTTDGAGVNLVYTPSVAPPAPTPVTSTSITSLTETNCSLSYSGGSGGQFVLVTSPTVETPLGSWTALATNIAASGSFTVPISLVDTQGFYRIRSE